jgi:hypothetical protein
MEEVVEVVHLILIITMSEQEEVEHRGKDFRVPPEQFEVRPVVVVVVVEELEEMLL